MYYIHKLLKTTRREVLFFQVIPTLSVLFGALLITLLATNMALNEQRYNQQQLLVNSDKELVTFMTGRLEDYDNILRGASEVYNVTGSMNKARWHATVSTYEIEKRYPGTLAIGYVSLIDAKNKMQAEQALSSEYNRPITIFPNVEKNAYSIVSYIYPTSKENLQVIGYDMSSEESRQNAMNDAREQGTTTLSNAVTLVQDDMHAIDESSNGLIYYLPVYGTADPKNADDRRKSIKAYMYVAFRVDEFIEKNKLAEQQGYAVAIINNGIYIYESKNYNELNNESSSVKTTHTYDVSGKTITIHSIAAIQSLDDNLQIKPGAMLITGLVMSGVIAGLIYILLGNRVAALSKRQRTNIESAKDELLSLASHQLRTPATGVKQYLGMVLGGYAGKLQNNQIALLEKAYKSNERQLATINEMLVVAKADAGELKLHKQQANISKLITSVIQDMDLIIRSRKQACTFENTTDDLVANIDVNYFRMVLENMISNASKYTLPRGKINIRVKGTRGKVYIYITDTGVGVAPKDIPLLFKKFSRIPNSLTNSVDGSGIGLYMSKKIIQKHGGKILFHSTEGKGSTVEIIVPKS